MIGIVLIVANQACVNSVLYLLEVVVAFERFQGPSKSVIWNSESNKESARKAKAACVLHKSFKVIDQPLPRNTRDPVPLYFNTENLIFSIPGVMQQNVRDSAVYVLRPSATVFDCEVRS